MNPYREPADPGNRCPRCTVPLTVHAVGDARVDECSRCAGVFVAADVMPRLLDALDLGGEVLTEFAPGTPVTFGGGPMYLKCPRCAEVMNRQEFARGAKVVVDVCRVHGTWFDDAELRAVVVFAAGGGMERAAARAAADEQAYEAAHKARKEAFDRRMREFHGTHSPLSGLLVRRLGRLF